MSKQKVDTRPKTWKKAVEFYTRQRIQQATSSQTEKKDNSVQLQFEDPLGIVKFGNDTDDRATKYRQKIWDMEAIAKAEIDNPDDKGNGNFFVFIFSYNKINCDL